MSAVLVVFGVVLAAVLFALFGLLVRDARSACGSGACGCGMVRPGESCARATGERE